MITDSSHHWAPRVIVTRGERRSYFVLKKPLTNIGDYDDKVDIVDNIQICVRWMRSNNSKIYVRTLSTDPKYTRDWSAEDIELDMTKRTVTFSLS